jgi:hypothetical protein
MLDHSLRNVNARGIAGVSMRYAQLAIRAPVPFSPASGERWPLTDGEGAVVSGC